MSDNFVNPFKKTAKKLIILIKKKRNTKKSFKTNNMDKSMRYNEKYVELMDDLAYIMRVNKEFMRSKAYENAKNTILSVKQDIVEPKQLKGLPGIGNTIYDKLETYTKTNTLDLIEKNKDLVEKRRAMSVFTNIYGIGEKKAEELISKKIYNLADLEKQKHNVLNDKQIIGLKYYDDILERIPRSEIESYESIFRKHFPKKGNGSMEIVGSYRRGAESSGDIDVILTHESNDVFVDFVDKLLKAKIIMEVLSRGPTKCLVIAKLPGAKYARRVDFLYSSAEEFPFAILYFTGSKEFNTAMRERALTMGYTLNEHGFSKMEGRKKGPKLEQVFENEKAIFDFLKMKYKTPVERNEASVENMSIPEPEVKKPANKRVTKKAVPKKVAPKKVSDIDDFIKNGIQVLENKSEKELAKMIDLANDAFHTKGEPIMTDDEYDILREFMEKKYPKNEVLQEVGAAVEKNKVKLPYEMWSMDKIKPDTDVLVSWKKKYTGPYVISCKLDGVSGLYTTDGEIPKLYTRGDGKVGQDISHMIPYLKLPKMKDLVIRGEFIIKKNTFEEKYAAKFANPRNLVAGIVNQKTKDAKKYNDIDFVAYELIKYPNMDKIKPSKQMELLQSMEIDCVKNSLLQKTKLTNDELSGILKDWRTSYDYEIDGIIVCNDAVYPRSSGNPKHAFAFKMVLSDQMAEAHVVDVLWSASKDGYLKPRVQIMPVKLGGVTITYVTGFNGSFIENNKIGVGAIITLIRSGDVIPYIQSVTKPASQAKMPNEKYVWNDTHIDIMLEDKSQNETVLEKNISGFFKQLGVDGLAIGNVRKIIKAGFDDVCKVIHITKAQLLEIDGFKEKMADKLYQGIQEKVKNASLIEIAAYSNVFGRGFSQKKMELIFENYPDIIVSREPDNKKIEKMSKIKGLEKKTAEAFVSHIEDFKVFLNNCKLQDKLKTSMLETKPINKDHVLYDKTIVMTGFRDKELETQIKNAGGKTGSSVNKNTFVLIVKDASESSGKMEDAKKHGVVIMEKDNFIKKYL